MIRIGTRGSKLALIQAGLVKQAIMTNNNIAENEIEIVPIITKGDQILDRPLSQVGGKGLFTQEIEDKLLDKSIDLAVHSMKDMTATFPTNLDILSCLPREDVRDAFISFEYKNISDLPIGAKIGTSSIRRKAQLLNIRPDLIITTLRGNVLSRIEKLKNKEMSGAIFATAGLKRLEIDQKLYQPIAIEDMLPAVAQGAIGIECNINNEYAVKIAKSINHQNTYDAIMIERQFMITLEGGCNTPMAAYCTLDHDKFNLSCFLANPDTNKIVTCTKNGQIKDGLNIALKAALELKALL
jgi:hydroxymethylbilane synthase